MWVTLLAALGLLAARGQQPVVRQLAGQTAGLPSAEVMPVGHVLSMASDAGKRPAEKSRFFSARPIVECH
jgi:hypothetical protein